MNSSIIKTVFLCFIGISCLIMTVKCQCNNTSPFQYTVVMTCTNVKDKFPSFSKFISSLRCMDCHFPVLDQSSFEASLRVEDLNFTNGLVGSIGENAFSSIGSNTHNFVFVNNKLVKIAPQVFSNFSYLDSIILTNNEITKLDKVFEKTNVTLLNLSYNRVVTLGTMLDQLRVTKLNLSHNNINDISGNAFANAIFWEGRQWKKFPQMLDLSYNFIENLNSDTFKSFGDADKLKQLYLQENKIRTIGNNTFVNFSRLFILRLDGNGLSSLSAGSFKGLTTLEQLYLKRNNIKTLPLGLFSDLQRLEELDLAENKLTSLSINSFSGLTYLLKLNISHNDLKVFDNDYIYPLGRLSNLDISSIKISSLNIVDLLKHHFRLRILMLNDNFWTCKDLVKLYKALNEKMSGFSNPSRHFDVPNLHGIACSRGPLDNYEDMRFDEFLNIISQDRVFEDLYDKRLGASEIEDEGSQIAVKDTLKSIQGIFYMVTIITIIIVIIFLQFVVRCLFKYLYWSKKIGSDKFSFMYARSQDNVELLN